MYRLKLTIKNGEGGLALIESLFALAILGVIAVATLSALGTGAKATIIAGEQATAESLARSQIEYIKNYDYLSAPAQYPVDPSLSIPTSWEVLPSPAAPVHAADDGLQKITVNINRNDRLILSLVTYKANR